MINRISQGMIKSRPDGMIEQRADGWYITVGNDIIEVDEDVLKYFMRVTDEKNEKIAALELAMAKIRRALDD